MAKYRRENEISFNVVTALEMQEIDNEAINKYGLSGIVLMENAGAGIVFEIENAILENDISGFIDIFCGGGNNGGDGFVIARYLLNQGYKVRCFLIGEEKKLKGDALVNYKIFKKIGGHIDEISENPSKKICFKETKIIVDAILGTGFSGTLKAPIDAIIRQINKAECFVVSVDIPSGMQADVTNIETECIVASLTCTIGLPKISLLLYPTKKQVGDLKVIDISFPRELLAGSNLRVSTITKEIVKRRIQKSDRDIHKLSYGSIFVLGGSIGMTGAPYLSCESAIAVGAGYVKLGIPEGLNSIMEEKLTETLTIPLAETDLKTISKKAFSKIKSSCNDAGCLLIGPGLSSHQETSSLLLEVVKKMDQNIVIDADGLNALAPSDIFPLSDGREIVLTPHIGEMVRLTGLKKEEIVNNPVEIAKKYSKAWNVVLVLKGATTIISTPSQLVYINTTGNYGMATAGTGDVLAGIIAGFLVQSKNALNSAICGVYLHGLCGDIVRDRKGERGLKATDLLSVIPDALKSIS